MKEVEIKLEVHDFRRIEKILANEDFESVSDWVFEDNWVFDFDDLRLKKGGKLLRLRKVKDKVILTFKKRTDVKTEDFKVREEIEVSLDNYKNTVRIFEELGLRVFFRYQKYRKEYSVSSNHVCLDKTPAGNFVEIEGEKKFIRDMAEKLGFTGKDFIKKTYYELSVERLGKGKFMIFEKEGN